MYNVWLGTKPVMNRKGVPARFSFDLAMYVKSQHKFAKVRSETTKGKWGDRLSHYQKGRDNGALLQDDR